MRRGQSASSGTGCTTVGWSWLIIFLVLLSAAVFFILAIDLEANGGFAWDRPIIEAIAALRRPWLTGVMRVITFTGQYGAIPIVALVTYWLWWREGRKRDALMLVVSLGGAALLNTLLKLLFARDRPGFVTPLQPAYTFSFPSGHTMAAVALYGLLAVCLWRSRHYVWACANGLWVLLIGFSRIYLGVHFPSDVLASLALGSLWLVVVLTGRAALDWLLRGSNAAN